MDLLATKSISKKTIITISLILLAGLCLLWLSYSANPAIWSVRNTLQYYALTGWWSLVGRPEIGDPGTLAGRIVDSQAQPVQGAWVLLSRWDGTTYTTRSNAQGEYTLAGVPEGTYRPVAGAPGYESVQFGGWSGTVNITAGEETQADVTLPAAAPHHVPPGQALTLSEPVDLTCTQPFEASATRRQVHFQSEGRPNQPTFYYTPVTATLTSHLPVVLIVYPGPADSWECASLIVVKGGYTVLATGPAYTFNLEADLDELEQVLMFARQGAFPGGDGSRMAILGGSYSSLHVQRLLQRGQEVDAALLLGPITDLFDMRRRLEDRTFIPPFGLDQAFLALGLPSREPLRYWKYSGAYQISPTFPPLAVLHSRSDDVVPYQQSELLAANLDLVGAPYELHFFDAGGHYLLAEKADADTTAIYETSMAFLAKYLQ
jgi:dipeptidyl aminopeptidase/acylaminoacyl peptidase